MTGEGKMYIISACLLGVNCKYNGGNNYCKQVKQISENHNYISVCPEVAGGLSAPRITAEIRGNKVYQSDGKEVTEYFINGAEIDFKKAIRSAREAGEEIELAILKARSPSCGAGKIYDGTFSGSIINGDGVFAKLLKQNGIKVITEEELK